MIAFSWAVAVFSQQMSIDDAAITNHRSFQFEGWHSRESTWLVPAISPLKFLEISAGLGFLNYEVGKEKSLLLQAKFLRGDLDIHGSAIALSMGVIRTPGQNNQTWYLNVPYSRQFLKNSLLHLNLGVSASKTTSWEHNINYGVRADFFLLNGFLLLSEVYTTDFNTPEMRGGLRLELIDGLLASDLTLNTTNNLSFAKPVFTIGVAFTP